MASQGPYKLVTVNNAPERAKRIVGRVIEALKDQYTIIHAANAESTNLHHTLTLDSISDQTHTGPESAKPLFEEIMPDIVVRSQNCPAVFTRFSVDDVYSSQPQCGR